MAVRWRCRVSSLLRASALVLCTLAAQETPQDGNVTTGALASASPDFDHDGVPDLALGYSGPAGGCIVLRRADRLRIELPGIDVPLTPALLAAGDFNADGTADLLISAPGAHVLYSSVAMGGAISTPFRSRFRALYRPSPAVR